MYSKGSEINPVIPDLSVTPVKFAKMSVDAQRTLLAHNASIGSIGKANPDWLVPPQCVRGVTTGELMDCMDELEQEFKEAGRKKANKIKRDKQAQEYAKKFTDEKEVKV